MTDCLFCKIARKELTSQIVYENEHIIAFKDINSVAPVHILVIPRKHVSNICDPKLLEDGLASRIFEGIQEVTRILGLKPDGFRVVANFGRDAGETVPHLHFHILAGRLLAWPPG